MFGFAISTHDYRVYCGDAPPSPTDEELKISRTNEENTRIKVEEKLKEIPPESRTNLLVYISRNPSSEYELQDIKILLLRHNEKAPPMYKRLYLDIHRVMYPDVWKGFDFSCFTNDGKR